jgi:hypothetical protein
MADCLSFVSNDSKTEKPEGTCCAGLKTVLKADAACLCEAFKSSAQLGVVLNITKAMSLPAACKISAPSAANCGCQSFISNFHFYFITCEVSRSRFMTPFFLFCWFSVSVAPAGAPGMFLFLSY